MAKAAVARSARRAQVIKALAHTSRVQIVEALLDGPLCVCDLQEVVGSDMSTVSRHLTIMKAAGVLLAEKRGLNVYYELRCQCLGPFFECVDKVITVHARSLQQAA